MKPPSQVRLTKQEQQELRALLQSGLQPVRTVLRALALRQLAQGQTVRQVAKIVASDAAGGVADQPSVSAQRAAAGLLRAARAGASNFAGRTPETADHRHGL